MESDGIGVAAFAACDVAMKQLPLIKDLAQYCNRFTDYWTPSASEALFVRMIDIAQKFDDTGRAEVEGCINDISYARYSHHSRFMLPR